MIDILNLAIPYFGLIFIGFACGKARGLPEQGLAWMNFFLLYVSLPALLFGIMSKTPARRGCCNATTKSGVPMSAAGPSPSIWRTVHCSATFCRCNRCARPVCI